MIIISLVSQIHVSISYKCITILNWNRLNNPIQGKQFTTAFVQFIWNGVFSLIQNKMQIYCSNQPKPCHLYPRAKHIASHVTWVSGVAQWGVNITYHGWSSRGRLKHYFHSIEEISWIHRNPSQRMSFFVTANITDFRNEEVEMSYMETATQLITGVLTTV